MAKATSTSKKAKETDEDKKAAEARKKEAQEKKDAEAKAKEEEREAKKVAKEEEKAAKHKEAIDSGKLIEGPDGEEFWESEKEEDKDYTLDERAVAVIEELKGSKVPLMGKDIQEAHGGGYPLYIPMFSTLKALGLIKEYRRRTGERGGGGKAYLYVGK